MFKAIEPLVVPVVDALTGLQVQIPRPNSDGEVVYKERVYEVSPMQLWPDVRVIILDWTNMIKAIHKDVAETIKAARKSREAVPSARELYEAKLLEAVRQPVEFDGVDYFGCWGWGSAVKRGQTIGLDVDVGRISRLAQSAEDASRYLRAFLPSSLYGGGRVESLRVLVLADGDEFKGIKIADGFELMAKSLFDTLRTDTTPDIRLSTGRQTYLGWHRYPWDQIKDEAIPIIKAGLEKAGTPNWVLTQLDSNAGDYKRQLVELDEDMLEHPYLKLAANVSIRELMTEIASTVPIETYVRIAVPVTVKTVVWDGDTKLICVRHPMDSWQSQSAYEVDTALEGYQEQLNWVRSLQTAQLTVTNKDASLKGLSGIMPDEFMDGYDLIVSEEDFKMLAGKSLKAFRNHKKKVRVLSDVVIALTQVYAPGCAFGIDPEMWKAQGGDFDGDMGFLSPASSIPKIWGAAKEWYGRDKTYKIKKTTTPLDKRPEMLVQVLGNMVGFATNVMSGTFVVQPDERQGMADKMFAGGVIVEPTVDSLDWWCNKEIKIMTDMFKRFLDAQIFISALFKGQQVLSSNYGGSATWALWGQDGSPAFVNTIPMFYHQLSQDQLNLIDTNEDARRDMKNRIHIPPEQYNGTIAKIYEVVQPWILEQYQKTAIEKDGKKYSFLDLIDYKPGSHYLGWAPHVSDEHLNSALEMVREFAGQSRLVYWNSSEDTINFKSTWQHKCNLWATQFPSREEAVSALWRAAHHATISGSGAAAVFMGFPEECLKIVADKPGLAEQETEGVRSLLIGVDYNFNGQAPDEFGPVSLRILELPWRGEFRKVAILDEPMPGMKLQQDFPPGTVGMTAKELREGGRFYTEPEPGLYIGRFLRNRSGKSFRVFLTKLSE